MNIDVPIIAIAVETVTIICSVVAVIYKLGKTVERFELIGKQQAGEISELKTDVKNLGAIVTTVAVQTTRQDIFEERLVRLERAWDELRHGHGFVIKDDHERKT